jgi:transcriptional regulator with XRE-family HTH domain
LSRARQRLARRVHALRALHGWDAATLASRASLHQTYINALEQGTQVSLQPLPRIARALGVSWKDLLAPTPWGLVKLMWSEADRSPVANPEGDA